MTRRNQYRKDAKSSPGRWLAFGLLGVAFCLLIGAGLALFAFYMQLDRSLPSTQALKQYHPPLVSTMYAADGSLIGEFFLERRYLVPLNRMPTHLIQAFLAAEDARFYDHRGVDILGIVRALIKNLEAGEIVQGGSTITQQVVKSLLLSPERTWMRKAKEAILAYRIDHTLSKDEILELYLNQIYFGSGTYGVEAAALTYFNKHVNDLDVAEAALLAGLPKAPSRYSPFQNFAAARDRQRFVLQRMAEVGFISTEAASAAFSKPLDLAEPRHWTLKELNSFSEEVRRQVENRYGRDGLYKEGLRIHTTMDPSAQRLAEEAVDRGLREITRRRGFRKPSVNVTEEARETFLKELAQRNRNVSEGRIVDAMVLGFNSRDKTYRVHLGVLEAELHPSGWEWTRIPPKQARKLFRPGDVIQVRLDRPEKDAGWSLVLEPELQIEGALLAIVPETGRVLCMVGGKDFEKSQFNRTTQAVRQPGSAFKPIIYAAAIDKGYTEASILVDSPIARVDPSIRGLWRPSNYDGEFWGPILLRKALINSRNVVTVKLLDAIGVHYAIDYARRLGITSPLTPTLSLALGASGVTLWELITAYSAFAYQGERVQPYMIDKVYDRYGHLLEEHQVHREPVITPQTAYVMTHLLQGVIQEGTGKAAKSLGRPAAGKTGTTNEMKDAWFIGYTPSVLTGVWVGYDDHNRSLGKGETGGRAACPIWLRFMESWLKDKPIQNFPIPPGVVFAKIDGRTGTLTRSDDPGAIYAAFLVDRMPSETPTVHEASEQTRRKTDSPSLESFFKSDLF